MPAVADRLKLTETGLPLRAGSQLREADGGGQRREIVIISEGWGSSGYYSADVLKRDIPRIFPVGTHMYLNHQTEREEIERPERDVAHLVGKIVETPRLAGIDVVAVAEIYPHWVDVIEAMSSDIGLSIVAYGLSTEGDAAGKRGPVITALTEGFSVDYVTRAGAGGKIGRMIESAIAEGAVEEKRNAAHWLESRIHRDFTYYADNLFGEGYMSRDERIALSGAIGEALKVFADEVKSNAPSLLDRDPYDEPGESEVEVEEEKRGSGSGDRKTKKKEEANMAEISDSELAELRESAKSAKTLESRLDDVETKQKESDKKVQEAEQRAERAEDALLMNRAAVVAKETLDDDKFKALPGSARARAIEAALSSGDLPATGEGDDRKLDESALKERVRGKAEEEAKYLAEAGVSAVSGFGSGGNGNGDGGGEGGDAGTKAVESLQKRFEEGGMSEEAAKAAAEGR